MKTVLLYVCVISQAVPLFCQSSIPTTGGGGSSVCTVSGSPTNGYVLTATNSANPATCDWAPVGGASVTSSSIANADYAAATGTNTITASTATTYSTYGAGLPLVLQIANANTGAVTINIGSQGAIPVTLGGNALTGGELQPGPAMFTMDASATHFQLAAVAVANQSAHAVNIGPTSGGAAQPTWRLLVAGDLPAVYATYPGAGVPLSTGSAWGTSYTVGTTGSDLCCVLISGALPAVSAANLTSFPTFNQNTTGTAAGLASYPALCSGGLFSQGFSSGSNNCGTPSGSGTIFQANGTGLSSSATVNFLNSAATNGLTFTFTNPSAGNVQLGLTGGLTVSGGGTGLGTMTANTIYEGNGTSALAATSITDNGTTVSTTEPISAPSISTGASPPASSVCTAGTAGMLCATEGSTATGTLLGVGVFWPNSSTHRWGMINNNVTDVVVGAATTDTLTNKTFDTAGTGNSLSIAGVAATTNTGTGAIARATSPAFVTPALGTPASGVATNLTGLPVSTGISGLASGIAAFLAAPSSANLLSAMTTSTGTGNLVFATSPAFVTPALGTPASGNASNLSNLPITLTTAGSSGASTYTQSTNTLNIPQYSGGGGGSGGGLSGWSNNSPASFTVTATQYAPFAGGGSTSGTGAESIVQSKVSAAATITGIQCSLNAAFGAGASAVITLRDGGSSQTPICTISAGGTVGVSSGAAFNVSAGDLVDFQITVSGTVTNASPQIIINYAVGTSGVGCAPSGSSTDILTDNASTGCNSLTGLQANSAGLLTKIDGIATVGTGLPIIGWQSVLSNSSATSLVTLATSPVAGEYEIHYSLDLHTPCTTGTGGLTLTMQWTGNSARTEITGSWPLNPTQGVGTGFYTGSQAIHVLSGNVTYTPTLAACTTGTPSWDGVIWMTRVN